jgi:UDP-2,3-diacylglucosamine pyrophosphatase LpxH
LGNLVHKALDRCYKGAKVLERDICDMKAVFFSDHHRGNKDAADDFAKCESTYLNALEHYNNRKFELYLLGDVEEFWENPFGVVIQNYQQVLRKEKEFFDERRLFRIWGNHDDEWRYLKMINKWLGTLFPKLYVPESYVIKLVNNTIQIGDILLVHGHQGSLESDRFAGISKFFVRYIWRNIQRIFKIPLSTPATDFSLRSDLDETMYSWASNKNRTAIFCGHTHQAVYMSLNEREKLQLDIQNNIDLPGSQINQMKAKMESLDTKFELGTDYATRRPCYFNTGCCSYSDGDITGIEIDGGRINLIKWNVKGERVILSDNTGHNKLEDIFS